MLTQAMEGKSDAARICPKIHDIWYLLIYIRRLNTKIPLNLASFTRSMGGISYYPFYTFHTRIIRRVSTVVFLCLWN